MTLGTVMFWKSEKGWGAIMSDALPLGSDAWAHFSVIEGTGYRELQAGDLVDFDYETARQDSFEYRAIRIRHIAPGPPPLLQHSADGTVRVIAAETPADPEAE